MSKIDARGWEFLVEATDLEGALWLEIGGLNSFELDPSANNETVDYTTFRSNGEYEGEAMQRGGSIEFEGFVERDDDDIAIPDPGQARIDELGAKTSKASHGRLRFRHDTDDDYTVWRFYVEPGAKGGGNNDKTSWAATLTRSGAATTAPVVVTP